MWQMVGIGAGICVLVAAGLFLYTLSKSNGTGSEQQTLVWDVAPELSGRIEISDCGRRGANMNCAVRNHTSAQIFDSNPNRAYTITCFDATNLKLYETWMRPVEGQTAERQDLCPWDGLQRVRIVKEKW